MEIKDNFYTPQEISKHLKLRLSTVWYLIRQGKIPAVKIGKHYRIKGKDLEELIKRSYRRVKRDN